jgi:hypothetical protein
LYNLQFIRRGQSKATPILVPNLGRSGVGNKQRFQLQLLLGLAFRIARQPVGQLLTQLLGLERLPGSCVPVNDRFHNGRGAAGNRVRWVAHSATLPVSSCDLPSMIELRQNSDECAVRSDKFELAFLRRGDRWEHLLSIHGPAGWRPVLESTLPAESAESQPGNPVFQDLRCENPRDQVFEFQLMGQAGRGFYSAAITFDAAAMTITFDLCARELSPGAAILSACRYLLAAGEAQIPIEVLETPANPSPWRRIDKGEPTWISLGCDMPPLQGRSKTARSMRWRYQIGPIRQA